jgi:hypothetical protein
MRSHQQAVAELWYLDPEEAITSWALTKLQLDWVKARRLALRRRPRKHD